MASGMVLDTTVLVAALGSPEGASRQILRAALEGRIRIMASVALMLEYEAVLTRPAHLDSFALTAREIGAFLDALAAGVQPVRIHFHWRPVLRDPGDEMVLEAAVNGEAGWIVSFNIRHLEEGALRFGIRVMNPASAWARIRKELPNEKE